MPKAQSRSDTMDRKGAQVMFVCIFILMYVCLYVFRGFLETDATYGTESGTIW